MKYPSEWERETRVWMMIILTGGYFFVELVVGRMTNCVALTADAFHVLSDAVALVITLIAIKAAKKKRTDNFTFGWKRAELVGALVNSVFLLALCFTIAVEAFHRLFLDEKIEQPIVLLVTACIGLLINLLGLLVFHEHAHIGGCNHDHSHGHSHGEPAKNTTHSHGSTHGHSHAARADSPVEMVERHQSVCSTHELITQPVKKEGATNSRALYLHILGDALASVAVIVAALFMWQTTWSWRYMVDPVLSLFITGLLVKAAYPLAKETVWIMLQGTPTSVNIDAIRKELKTHDDIEDVTDITVWQLTDVQNIGTCTLHLAATADVYGAVGTAAHSFRVHGVQNITIQPFCEEELPNTAAEQQLFSFGSPENFDLEDPPSAPIDAV